MRRLFSTFARGWPGAGLLLMRVVVGASVIASGVREFQADQTVELAAINLLAISAGALLALGLCTPIAGILVGVVAIWGAVAQHASLCPVVLSAAMGAGLALAGPGAWSLDAWLFGWKRIDLED